MSLFTRKADRKAEERAEEFRNILLTNSTSRESEAAKKAVTFCEWSIEEYEGWFTLNKSKWLRWQTVVIIGGVVATLAGVITIPDDWVPQALKSFGWLRGVPAGLVTIASGFLSSFTYKEDAVRHEMTAGFLWIELVRFQTHASPYDKGKSEDTSTFVNNVSRLIEGELRGWSAVVQGNKPAQNGAAEVGSAS